MFMYQQPNEIMQKRRGCPARDLPTWGAERPTRLEGAGVYFLPLLQTNLPLSDPGRTVSLQCKLCLFLHQSFPHSAPAYLELERLLPFAGASFCCTGLPVIIRLEKGLFRSIETTGLITTEEPNVCFVYGPTPRSFRTMEGLLCWQFWALSQTE